MHLAFVLLTRDTRARKLLLTKYQFGEFHKGKRNEDMKEETGEERGSPLHHLRYGEIPRGSFFLKILSKNLHITQPFSLASGIFGIHSSVSGKSLCAPQSRLSPLRSRRPP